MSSADFTINGLATPPEIAVSGGSTVTLALTSISGVRTVVWSFVGNSNSALVNPILTLGGSPLGATATFTMPAGTDQGYRIQCQINGGRDDEGTWQSSYTKTAIVGVVNANGFVPFCSGETFERNAVYGYTMALNVLGDAAGGSSTIPNDSVTFAKMQNIGVGLIGNDSGTADPKLITLGGGVAFIAGALALATIADQRILGNVSGVSASPIALTGAQVTATLSTFVASGASHAKGLVPDPGASAGTTRFLREDATWATPAGTFTNPSNPGDNGKLGYASAGAIAWSANITTDATSFFFGASPATGALLGVGKTATVLNGLLNAAGQDTLIRWGVVATDELTFGGTSGVAAIRSRVKTGGSHSWEINGSPVATWTSAGAAHVSLASTGTVAAAFSVTDAAHTTLTASTERNSVLFDLSQTRQWATGALTNQRSLRVLAPTISFAGASTVTTAATVSISGAPAAGTNATLTQALALWIEAGGIGYGSSAALTGLNRFPTNSLMAVGRSSTSTDINLVRWGVTATDELALGDDTAASIRIAASATADIRLGGASKWTFSTTQLDAHSGSFVNVLALNGTRIAEGVLGTALADADEVLSVAGGNVYEQITAPTANRAKRLAVTGGPVLGEIISIRRFTTDANTLTINDEAGNFLYLFPAGQKRLAEFVFNGTKFQLIGHMKLS